MPLLAAAQDRQDFPDDKGGEDQGRSEDLDQD